MRAAFIYFALFCLQLDQARGKDCFGIGHSQGPMRNSETIDAKNVHHFYGCTNVTGNVIFEAYAIKGDPYTSTPPMTAEMVVNGFSSVKTISGYIKILSWPSELQNFSVFSNLETVRGVELFRNVASIVIQDAPYAITKAGKILSQVTSLGFRSLKSIENGNVYIGYMTNLCYENTINWTKIIKNPVHRVNFIDGVFLRANKECNETCDSTCDGNGCWGSGYQNCFSCPNLSEEGRCVTECGEGFYQSESECVRCDDQCRRCYGEGPTMCFQCKHYTYTGTCVHSCPLLSRPNSKEKICEPYDEEYLREEINRLERDLVLLRYALSKISNKESPDVDLLDRA